MATVNKNLSDQDFESLPDCTQFCIGIAVSEWNSEITSALLEGAVAALEKAGVPEQNILIKHTPGSFELPLAAQFMLKAYSVDAVVCLGSVIKGETDHFDFVCQTTAEGIKDVSLNLNKPVIFGVLTDNNMEQAKARSGGEHGNKGTEAAVAALKMVALQRGV